MGRRKMEPTDFVDYYKSTKSRPFIRGGILHQINLSHSMQYSDRFSGQFSGVDLESFPPTPSSQSRAHLQLRMSISHRFSIPMPNHSFSPDHMILVDGYIRGESMEKLQIAVPLDFVHLIHQFYRAPSFDLLASEMQIAI